VVDLQLVVVEVVVMLQFLDTLLRVMVALLMDEILTLVCLLLLDPHQGS
jgi:hypothetical protein